MTSKLFKAASSARSAHNASRRVRLGSAVALGAVLVLGMSGCGSEPGADKGDTSSKEENDTSSGELTAQEEKFCAEEADLAAQFATLDPAKDTAKVVDLIEGLAKVAPEELADEFEIVAASYADRDDSGQPKTTDPEYINSIQTAGSTIDTYVAEKCHPEVAKAATLKAPAAGAKVTGKTECPKADGSSKRTTEFASAPPNCIDKDKTYIAKFATSKGDFEVALDAKAAPIGVNNLVVLARYHFYDGIPFHRIVPDFVAQAGDPLGEPWGTHGPGYTIAEEPPADSTYEKYDFAMAKTAEPSSTGSQFFVVTGSPDALNQSPTYALLGSVTEGRDVVDEIGTVPGGGPNGDTPTEAVVIESVTIDEK